MTDGFVRWNPDPRGSCGWIVKENGCHIWTLGTHESEVLAFLLEEIGT